MTTKRRQEEHDLLSSIKPLEVDLRPWSSGVLLSDEIEYYARNHQLVCPFVPDNLKPAAYELTVGDEVMVKGEFRFLKDEPGSGTLCIPPFDVAVIKTGERVNLPRFIIGRWNIRTRWAYHGLIWAGGPQVDPGYVGHLFCPIYNLSNKPFYIRKGETFGVFDFVKTTRFYKDPRGKGPIPYRRPPGRVIMEDYGVDDFRSGLSETKEELDNVSERMQTFTTLVFVVLAVIVAALALPYFSKPGHIQLPYSLLDVITLFLSLLAVFISFQNRKKDWWRIKT